MTDDDQRLLPFRPVLESNNTSPRVLDLTGEDADLVFDALSSTTARRILAALHSEPAPPSELADTLDLSLQNVHYHIRNLRDADLIKEVEKGYSEKGVEMSIYAPTSEPVVFSGSASDEQSELRELLEKVVGVVALFGFLSVLAQWAVTHEIPLIGPSEPANPIPVPGPFNPGTLVPRGLMFFVGGIAMLVIIVGLWYYQRLRR